MLTLRRVMACRSTSMAAVACTRLNACASSPSSSWVDTSIAASRGTCSLTSSVSATRTSSVSASVATSVAALVICLMGPAIDRLTATARAKTSPMSSATPAPIDHTRVAVASARFCAASVICPITCPCATSRSLDCAPTVLKADAANESASLELRASGARSIRVCTARASSPCSTDTTRPARSWPACSTNRTVEICASRSESFRIGRPASLSAAAMISAMPPSVACSLACSSDSSAVSWRMPSASLLGCGTSRNASMSASSVAR